jgi:hypothetical protein
VSGSETHPAIGWLMTNARRHRVAGRDTRPDFTVIGPAVNLTAHIESMRRQSGRQLLLSSDFVGEGGISARSLGHHALKGVGRSGIVCTDQPGREAGLIGRAPLIAACWSGPEPAR